MKFHIVRNQETLKEILNTYSLTINEIKENNRHVRDWNKLIPGTKLKIPIINEAVEQDMLDMEPFIEDYYPRSNEFIFEEKNDESKDKTMEEQTGDINQENLEEIKEDLVTNKEEIKEVTNKQTEDKKVNSKYDKQYRKQDYRNISYILYQPYPVYYPIYIKVK